MEHNLHLRHQAHEEEQMARFDMSLAEADSVSGCFCCGGGWCV
jgi:hypothetical protein